MEYIIRIENEKPKLMWWLEIIDGELHLKCKRTDDIESHYVLKINKNGCIIRYDLLPSNLELTCGPDGKIKVI